MPVFERNVNILKYFQENQDEKANNQNLEYLDLKNIYYSFDKKNIISNFSQKFSKGRIYCLIGPNGSGKSTLMNIISGIYPVGSDNYNAAKCFGYADQMAGLFPGTLDENIWFDESDKFSICQDDCMNIGELKKKTGNQYMHDNLSGGEKQRISLSRALHNDSPFVLLDEPTNHLDKHYVQKLKTKLRQLAQSGKGIVCISHDKEIIEFADEIVALKG